MEKEVNFQVKLQGASMQMSVSVRAGATGADLLEAIKRSIGGHEIVGGEMKVLSAGKRVAPDTSVASLRNSSPLLVLGVKPAQLQSSPPKTTESFSLLSSSPDARNAADRAIEMENAKMDKLSEAALEFAKQNGADGGGVILLPYVSDFSNVLPFLKKKIIMLKSWTKTASAWHSQRATDEIWLPLKCCTSTGAS